MEDSSRPKQDRKVVRYKNYHKKGEVKTLEEELEKEKLEPSQECCFDNRPFVLKDNRGVWIQEESGQWFRQLLGAI